MEDNQLAYESMLNTTIFQGNEATLNGKNIFSNNFTIKINKINLEIENDVQYYFNKSFITDYIPLIELYDDQNEVI